MIRKVPKQKKTDWDQFRTLLRVSLINEWRQQRSSGNKKKQRMPMFLRSLIFYWVMGFSLGISLVMRAPPSLYLLFCYAYFMMMAGFSVILECSQVLMIPDDLDILSHRPVSSTTFFWARISHMLIFILIFSTVLCIGPTVISGFLPGAPKLFPVVFAVAALLAVLFTAGLIMMIYTALLRWVRFEKIKSIVTGIQFLFMMVLIFLYQWIARTGWETSGMGFHLKDSWLRWLPPGWFAVMAESVYQPESQQILTMSLFAFTLSILILIFGFRHLSFNYLYNVSQYNTSSTDIKRQKSFGANRSFCRSIFKAGRISHSETRAGFFLSLQLIRRDRSVKLTLLPMLAMPSVIVLWGMIESDIYDPFIIPLFSGGTTSMQLLPFFVAFLIFMTVKGSVYIRDWEARWIFQSAPVQSPIRLWRGIRLGLFISVVGPFYFILMIVFCSQFLWTHAVQHTIYLFFLGLVFMSFVSIRNREFPFSRKRERGERIGSLMFLFLLIPFQAVALVVHFFAYKNQFSWFLSMSLLLLLWAVLEISGNRWKNREWMPFEFSD